MSKNFSPTGAAGDMSDSYTQPPPDIYFVEIEELDLKKSSSSGKLYYEARLRVVDGEFKNCKFWDNYSLSEKALWKLGEMSVSAGNQQDWDIESEAETRRMLKGKIGKCRTKWEEYEGTKRTKVQKWLLFEDNERQRYPNKAGGNANLPDGGPSQSQSSQRSDGPGSRPASDGARAHDDVPF